MSERSKELDSSSSNFGCVGSNPTECNFLLLFLSERTVTFFCECLQVAWSVAVCVFFLRGMFLRIPSLCFYVVRDLHTCTSSRSIVRTSSRSIVRTSPYEMYVLNLFEAARLELVDVQTK